MTTNVVHFYRKLYVIFFNVKKSKKSSFLVFFNICLLRLPTAFPFRKEKSRTLNTKMRGTTMNFPSYLILFSFSRFLCNNISHVNLMTDGCELNKAFLKERKWNWKTDTTLRRKKIKCLSSFHSVFFFDFYPSQEKKRKKWRKSSERYSIKAIFQEHLEANWKWKKMRTFQSQKPVSLSVFIN